MLVIDLKDCFFTIALRPDAAPSFAFALPSLNSEPMQKYHRIMLPQGMKNSPTMSVCGSKCFTTGATAVFKGFVVSLYGLYTASSRLPCSIAKLFVLLCFFLDKFALCIAADKVPTVPLLKYLRLLLFEQKIVPQPIVLWTYIKTLNYLQKLLGTISWLTPTLGISTEALSPLFHLLKRDTDLVPPLLTSWMQKPVKDCNS